MPLATEVIHLLLLATVTVLLLAAVDLPLLAVMAVLALAVAGLHVLVTCEKRQSNELCHSLSPLHFRWYVGFGSIYLEIDL